MVLVVVVPQLASEGWPGPLMKASTKLAMPRVSQLAARRMALGMAKADAEIPSRASHGWVLHREHQRALHLEQRALHLE